MAERNALLVEREALVEEALSLSGGAVSVRHLPETQAKRDVEAARAREEEAARQRQADAAVDINRRYANDEQHVRRSSVHREWRRDPVTTGSSMYGPGRAAASSLSARGGLPPGAHRGDIRRDRARLPSCGRARCGHECSSGRLCATGRSGTSPPDRSRGKKMDAPNAIDERPERACGECGRPFSDGRGRRSGVLPPEGVALPRRCRSCRVARRLAAVPPRPAHPDRTSRHEGIDRRWLTTKPSKSSSARKT